MDENLRRRAERSGVATSHNAPQVKKRPVVTRLPMTIMLLGLALGMGRPAEVFTSYGCSNRSNIGESYSLLGPEAFAASDGNGEMETVIYGEIVQMKQERIIPIFRCQVIKTIVSQYCSHWSSAKATRYILFREPKPLEA